MPPGDGATDEAGAPEEATGVVEATGLPLPTGVDGEDEDEAASARAALAAEVSAGSDGPNLAPTRRGQPTPIANPTAAITPTRTQEG